MDLTYLRDVSRVTPAIDRLRRQARDKFGLLLHARLREVELAAIERIGSCDTIWLQLEQDTDLAEVVARCRQTARRVGIVVTCQAEAEQAGVCDLDFLVAKGNEAGGRVGEETTFVLLQRLLGSGEIPVVAWGGIGASTAAACRIAGAAGVVLDWQLALTRESPLEPELRQQLATMDDSHSVTVSSDDRHCFRLFQQPGMTAVNDLPQVVRESIESGIASTTAWEDAISSLIERSDVAARLWPVGQDAMMAASWAAEAPTVGRALTLFRNQIDTAIEQAVHSSELAAGGPLAESHGTRFPLVQGPMTLVSDVPQFAFDVAEGGGLPVLALALMGKEQVTGVLKQTSEKLGSRPWGVGLWGLAEDRPRAEQLSAIEESRPPFALLAGGRPKEAAALEARGIATYLYAPSPKILESFLAEGARRFVLEGRECGGNIGPLSSFMLWEAAIRVLLDADLSDDEASQIHVLFAGGIHDCLTGAMVSALAQPLVQRGMKIGALMGTAYLFTDEIVESRAVIPGFQEEAVRADRTVLLEAGAGYATRCAATEYCGQFAAAQRRLLDEGHTADEIRRELMRLNLGRLRIASKGIAGVQDPGTSESRLIEVGDDGQLRDGMYPLGQIAALKNNCVSVRQLHEDVCDGAVAILRSRDDAAPLSIPATPTAAKPMDVAIVGMGCLLPGALNIAAYWHNILSQHDCVREVPEDRFHADRWFSSGAARRDKIRSKWGGFLDDVPFDPMKYGVPPTALKHIEPMQLLALELVDQTIRDAGYATSNPHKERTSVIFGAGGGIAELGAAYSFRAMLPQFVENPDEKLFDSLPEWTEDSFAGILLNVVAGRVSNRFDFGGTNFTVDAACASSLSAIYLACRELVDGTSDMVITGGCDTLQNPFSFLCFDKSGALSPRGRSRAFDRGADGIAISEGLAALALKRREDAERDGDRIYAIIRGVAGGSDGRSKGLTAPRKEGQVRTLRRAYAQAGIDPRTVDLFEAHGTGTAVGDATECLSLGQVLHEAGAPLQSCAIGSVKSTIGHTKCTAGAAGLIKAALALYYRVLPPTMHVESPNPKGALDEGPLYVNSELRPWIRGADPRRAGVSAFGFGGTNFHAILEEYDGDPLPIATRVPDRRRATELFSLAANSSVELAAQVRSFATDVRRAVDAKVEVDLANLAYSWHHDQPSGGDGQRAAIVAHDAKELQLQLDALEKYLGHAGDGRGTLPAGVHYQTEPLGRNRPLAFMFPGQGSQFPNMMRSLAVEFSEVASAFEVADDVLRGAYERPLSRYVFPPPAFSDQERANAALRLTSTDIAQAALGAAEVGLLRLLSSFGIEPQMAAGHSYGELTALYAAKSLDEPSLYKLSLARGRAILDMCRREDAAELGQMLAVRADGQSVTEALNGCQDVWLANLNSPRQTVLSGTKASLAEAATKLDEARLAYTPLRVGCAFHSPLMAPAVDHLAAALAQTEFAPPGLDVYSNATATVYPSEPEAIRRKLTEHLTSQVKWAENIHAMSDAGAALFVEVGPGRVLTKLTGDILDDRSHAVVTVDVKGDDCVTGLHAALAELFVHGVPVKFQRLYQGRALERLNLKQLSAEGRPKLGEHVWLVNGGYARPASAPRRRPHGELAPATNEVVHHKSEATHQDPVAPVPSASVPHESPSPPPTTAQPALAPPPTSSPAAMPAPLPVQRAPTQPVAGEATSLDPNALAQFQETMRQFLSTQATVLNAFLGAETAAPAPGLTAPVGQVSPPVTPAPVAPRPVVPDHLVHDEPALSLPAGTDTPAATTPSPQADQTQLQEELLSIVSDRTGYPADMLALDANLEADLGIDSIKRVEIIGAFRRAALPEIGEPSVEFVEQMNSAGTLQEILSGVAQLAVTHRDASPGQAGVAPLSGSPHTDQGELRDQLLAIVSDRTGYPADMLALDANLEADLGIDSIKRVEIIGAFRRAALPEIGDPSVEFVEQMNSAGTLQEILSGVAQLAVTHRDASPGQAGVAPLSGSPHTDQGELRDQLLAIVSDRTGYPADMLALDANLEADLGIDSIKRVEIIGAFRRAALPTVEEPPAWFMEQMAAATDLKTILEGVESLRREATGSGSIGTTESEVAIEPAVTGAPPAQACPRCVPEVIDAPLEPADSDDIPSGVIVVTNDGQGVAGDFVRLVELRGGRAEIIDAPDFNSRKTAEATMDRLRQQYGEIAGLVHLLPLEEAPSFPGISRQHWHTCEAKEVRGLLFLLQALSPELGDPDNGKMSVLAVTTGGGDFQTDSEQEVSRPWRGGLAGLLKTAAKEWEQARFRSIDVDALPDGLLLTNELAAAGPVEIGYRGGRRLAIGVLRRDLPQAEPNHPAVTLGPDDVVLATAGARGITAQIAHEIAVRTKATFVLLGRTALSETEEDPSTANLSDLRELRRQVSARLRDSGQTCTPREVEGQVRQTLANREIRQTLSAIAKAGSRVEYVACDVRDSAALATVIQDVQARHGHIDAVIHGAGVIEDHNIDAKTAASFDRVVGTKIDPVISLVELLDPARLKLLMLFSSVAGFFGNSGQADYAAANEMLNRIAARLQRLWDGKIVAINWGPWDGAGMVTEDVARQFAQHGVGLVGISEGRRAAAQELVHDTTDTCVIYGDGPWLEEAGRKSDSHDTKIVATPLLDGQTVRLNGDGILRADMSWSACRQTFLRDHVIDNKPVVPAAVAMELMVEAANAAAPSDWHVTHVENLRVLSGVVIENGECRSTLRAEPIQRDEQGGAWRVRITDPQASDRPKYEATVRLSAQQARLADAPEIPAIGNSFPLSVTEAYNQWLFHGPSFRAIAELRGVDASGIDAVLSPTTGQATNGAAGDCGWLIDPIMLDAAPQLAILWSRYNHGTTPLPNRMEAFHRFGPMGSGPVEVFLRVDPVTDETAFRADVWFVRDGKVVGRIEGLEGASSAALNRVAESSS